jgi:hypothetical protein
LIVKESKFPQACKQLVDASMGFGHATTSIGRAVSSFLQAIVRAPPESSFFERF